MMPERSQQLHDRFTRGEILTAAEQTLLGQWYADQDREEEARLATPPAQRLVRLRSEIDEGLAQLAVLTQRLQTLTSENETVRQEIATLQRQLARKPAAQPA